MKRMVIFVGFMFCCSQLVALEWSSLFSVILNWNQAMDYCKQLNEGGYDDWRLPDIDELRTLIQNCPNAALGGECNVSAKNSCLSKKCWYPKGSCYCRRIPNNYGHYSNLGDDDTIILWSSSYERYEKCAWGVFFDEGGVACVPKSDGLKVRCVRSGNGRYSEQFVYSNSGGIYKSNDSEPTKTRIPNITVTFGLNGEWTFSFSSNGTFRSREWIGYHGRFDTQYMKNISTYSGTYYITEDSSGFKTIYLRYGNGNEKTAILSYNIGNARAKLSFDGKTHSQID